MGIRSNREDALSFWRQRCSELGLPVGPPEQVELLASAWEGAVPRTGSRAYHLLYIGASRVARTLDLQEFRQTLQHAVSWAVLAGLPDIILVRGSLKERDGELWALAGDPGGTEIPGLVSPKGEVRSLWDGYFALQASGQILLPAGGSRAADHLVLCTDDPAEGDVSPGRSAQSLLACMELSQANAPLALAAAAQLSQAAMRRITCVPSLA